MLVTGTVGISLTALVGQLARRVFRADRKTLGRLIESTRLPLWIATTSVIIGEQHHTAARTLMHQAPEFFGAGLAGSYAYVLAKATCRAYRILRARRAGTPP